MSRIGRKPISIPKGVTVAIRDRELEVKGAKGVLKTPVPQGIKFKQEGEELIAERTSADQSALHGLARALANCMSYFRMSISDWHLTIVASASEDWEPAMS